MGLRIKPRSSTISGGGTMTETEELRVTSPEQLPDLVPLSPESSSRRVRSQSVNIPLEDHETLREIGSTLRRLSNDFENRFAERNPPRRASLTSFLNWRAH